jgi:hypothetical protein
LINRYDHVTRLDPDITRDMADHHPVQILGT